MDTEVVGQVDLLVLASLNGQLLGLARSMSVTPWYAVC